MKRTLFLISLVVFLFISIKPKMVIAAPVLISAEGTTADAVLVDRYGRSDLLPNGASVSINITIDSDLVSAPDSVIVDEERHYYYFEEHASLSVSIDGQLWDMGLSAFPGFEFDLYDNFDISSQVLEGVTYIDPVDIYVMHFETLQWDPQEGTGTSIALLDEIYLILFYENSKYSLGETIHPLEMPTFDDLIYSTSTLTFITEQGYSDTKFNIGVSSQTVAAVPVPGSGVLFLLSIVSIRATHKLKRLS